MKKKGFTLIELLAVIMILAIIALIVGVTIGNIIEKTRKEAFRQSVVGVIQSGENYIAKYLLESNGNEPTYPITFTCDGVKCINGEEELTFNGEVPKSGSLVIANRKDVRSLYLSDGKYCTAGTKDNLLVENSCADIDLTAPTVTGEADERTFKLNLIDNESGIAAYCVTETDDSSSCNWIETTDTYKEHTVDKNGTFYIFAKDKKDNVSNSLSLEAFLLSLGERILRDNPNLPSKTTTNGYGGVGNTTYYFTGNPSNNYVSFAGKTWRVLRVNEDMTVRLVLKDAPSTPDVRFSDGSSTGWDISKIYYSNSLMKTTYDSWYQTNIGNNPNYASKVATGPYFCEAFKASMFINTSDRYLGNATEPPEYNNYTPTFDCTNDGNGHGVITASIGGVTVDDTKIIGISDTGYNNGSNVMITTNRSIYLMSANYLYKSNGGGPAPMFFGLRSNPGMNTEANNRGSASKNLLPVINIRNDVGSAGSGTTGDMYTLN